MDTIKLISKIKANEIPWESVQSLLVERFDVTNEHSVRFIRAFKQVLYFPHSPRWILKGSVSDSENLIVSALCTLKGSDQIFVEVFTIKISPLVIDTSIRFTPVFNRELKQKQKGLCQFIIRLRCAGFEKQFSRLTYTILFYIVGLLAGAMVYVASVGLFLYGSAILLLFIKEPAIVFKRVIMSPKIGIAFLCFLVASAAIGGRAIRNIYQLIRKNPNKPYKER